APAGRHAGPGRHRRRDGPRSQEAVGRGPQDVQVERPQHALWRTHAHGAGNLYHRGRENRPPGVVTPNPDPMKKADSSRLETLEALIAEKRRQETFLAKLEERRVGTPEHVFNRLRDEYLTKLTDAQVKAAAEAENLSGGLEEDDAALAEIEAKLATLEEERIEMQLRAEVEEWDAKETQKKLTAMTAAISMAEKERDARNAVAERTRALLAEARGGAPAGPPPSQLGDGAPLRPTTAMAAGPNFDELAFLNSVVGRQSTPSAPAP